MIHIPSRQIASGLLAAAVSVAALTGCGQIVTETPGSSEEPTSQSSEPNQSATASAAPTASSEEANEPDVVQTKVIRVIDGDTIAVQPVDDVLETTGEHDGVAEHVVRLLGIDAPEMNYGKDIAPQCGAQTATNHLGSILPEQLPVIIQYDDSADRTDRYGRSLAYVSTPGDGDAGRQQIIDGYAMPWYPEGEPEPERIPEYRSGANSAASSYAGLHSQCQSICRD